MTLREKRELKKSSGISILKRTVVYQSNEDSNEEEKGNNEEIIIFVFCFRF